VAYKQTEGEFLYHVSCPHCGSSDANAVYSNGTSFCFSCEHWGTVGDDKEPPKDNKASVVRSELLHGEYLDLTKRGISKKTCQLYGYMVGADLNGNIVQIASYYNQEKEKIAQKLRYKDKTFKFIGKPKEALMFGQQLFPSGGNKLTICEGEIDALSVSEAFGKGYPIVSIKYGARSAKKEIKKHAEWISSFDEIYLWFDNDEVGREAVEECVQFLPAGRVKIVRHQEYKDANEVLVNLGKAGVIQTFYNAQDYKPDGFVTPDELVDEALEPIEVGLPWLYPKLTEISYGRRYGEVVAIGAGVSVGKTDFIMQQIAFDLSKGYKVATFMLEQRKTETLLRICGKLDKTPYHIPDAEIDRDKLKQTIHNINDKLFIYDNFGRIDWETIKTKIRSANVSYGVRLFYIDNLTALNAHADDERRHLDALMEEIATLALELDIWILLVSHLNPPKKGASHEAGGRVEQGHFTGSRAIMRWCYFMLGLERNTLAENLEDRQRGLIRVIKDRFTGRATGQTVGFIYDLDTGITTQSEEDFEIEEQEEDF